MKRITLLFIYGIMFAQNNLPPLIPISHGELIDKMTILQIKSERIRDETQLAHIRTELQALEAIYLQLEPTDEIQALTYQLKAINTQLWDVEDALRESERNQTFDKRFITLARMIYWINDKRGEIKRTINLVCKSLFVEEKSYADYKTYPEFNEQKKS